MTHSSRDHQSESMRKKLAAHREARAFSKKRVITLLKGINIYDSVFEDSLDGFSMLQNWLLPRFTQALRYFAAKGDEVYFIFDDMLFMLHGGPDCRTHDLPERLALSLAHTDGRFMILANWIRDLTDCLDDPDEFNSDWEATSFKALFEVLRPNSKPLKPDNQPGQTAMLRRLEKDNLHAKWKIRSRARN